MSQTAAMRSIVRRLLVATTACNFYSSLVAVASVQKRRYSNFVNVELKTCGNPDDSNWQTPNLSKGVRRTNLRVCQLELFIQKESHFTCLPPHRKLNLEMRRFRNGEPFVVAWDRIPEAVFIHTRIVFIFYPELSYSKLSKWILSLPFDLSF
jgi:hypothetical protein